MKVLRILSCILLLLGTSLLSDALRMRARKDTDNDSPGPSVATVPGPAGLLNGQESPAPHFDEAHSADAHTRTQGPAPDQAHAPAPQASDHPAQNANPSPVSHPVRWRSDKSVW